MQHWNEQWRTLLRAVIAPYRRRLHESDHATTRRNPDRHCALAAGDHRRHRKSKAGFKGTYLAPALDSVAKIRSTGRPLTLQDFPARVLLQCQGRAGPNVEQIVKDLEDLLSGKMTTPSAVAPATARAAAAAPRPAAAPARAAAAPASPAAAATPEPATAGLPLPRAAPAPAAKPAAPPTMIST